jgi:hypothetical protein
VAGGPARGIANAHPVMEIEEEVSTECIMISSGNAIHEGQQSAKTFGQARAFPLNVASKKDQRKSPWLRFAQVFNRYAPLNFELQGTARELNKTMSTILATILLVQANPEICLRTGRPCVGGRPRTPAAESVNTELCGA